MSPAFSLPSLDPKPGTDRRLVRRRFPEHFRFWVRGALFSHGPEASVRQKRQRSATSLLAFLEVGHFQPRSGDSR